MLLQLATICFQSRILKKKERMMLIKQNNLDTNNSWIGIYKLYLIQTLGCTHFQTLVPLHTRIRKELSLRVKSLPLSIRRKKKMELMMMEQMLKLHRWKKLLQIICPRVEPSQIHPLQTFQNHLNSHLKRSALMDKTKKSLACMPMIYLDWLGTKIWLPIS